MCDLGCEYLWDYDDKDLFRMFGCGGKCCDRDFEEKDFYVLWSHHAHLYELLDEIYSTDEDVDEPESTPNHEKILGFSLDDAYVETENSLRA
jgi:hypothetical protein